MKTVLVLTGGAFGVTVALLGVGMLVGARRAGGSAEQWTVAGRQTLGMGAALALLAASSYLSRHGATAWSLVALAVAVTLSVGSAGYSLAAARRRRRLRAAHPDR